jgi:hypothetical protein
MHWRVSFWLVAVPRAKRNGDLLPKELLVLSNTISFCTPLTKTKPGICGKHTSSNLKKLSSKIVLDKPTSMCYNTIIKGTTPIKKGL